MPYIYIYTCPSYIHMSIQNLGGWNLQALAPFLPCDPRAPGRSTPRDFAGWSAPFARPGDDFGRSQKDRKVIYKYVSWSITIFAVPTELWSFAVEVRQCPLRSGARGWGAGGEEGGRDAPLIKSRGPHLAGGALADLNRECQMSVDTAGPQRRAPELSGCRTSTARARSQWALRDLNCECKMSHRMSDRMSEEMSEYMPDRMCQKECQNICQTECQNICQIEFQLVGITRKK